MDRCNFSRTSHFWILSSAHHLHHRTHSERRHVGRRAEESKNQIIMDEAALRAMMPMGFGKQPGQHKAAQQVSSFAPEHDDDDDDSAGPSTRTKPSAPICTQRGPVGPSLAPGKRPASTQDEENDQDDDDGLTLEERAANRAAMEAADDDDDAEEDDDDEDDLGPEPENGVEGELPISHGAILKDHTKVSQPHPLESEVV